MISSNTVQLIKAARDRTDKWSELTPDELKAYTDAHQALKNIGEHTLEAANQHGSFDLSLTSGFSPKGGVRGSLPKDIWFALYPSKSTIGAPQIFMIVSERGIEYGFAPIIHTSDFSSQEIKIKVRQEGPQILKAMPFVGSPAFTELTNKLKETGNWLYRKKARLEPGAQEFQDLEKTIQFLHSIDGMKWLSAAVSKYVPIKDIDKEAPLLNEQMTTAANIFSPYIMEIEKNMETASPELPPATGDSLDQLLLEFMDTFKVASQGPFRSGGKLWQVASHIRQKMTDIVAPISNSNLLNVKWSAGAGNYAKIPWFGVLHSKETTSTQRGMYVCYLFNEDMSGVHLTLSLGATEYADEFGQAAGNRRLAEDAQQLFAAFPSVVDFGFASGEIDLKATTNLGKSYEVGAICSKYYDRNSMPAPVDLANDLRRLVEQYTNFIQKKKPANDISPEEENYTNQDALEDLFLSTQEFENLLKRWRVKKNMILQGAPGVGKTFVAQRLAYSLMGKRAKSRTRLIQFHQSYSYEDFVQGYRPNDNGFSLKDGVFYTFCDTARNDPLNQYVFIIDEINRGNLSKILGELMLLIEGDKRGPNWDVQLTYSSDDMPKFFVPENVYILGMMNTADRSLSMVDYALRRRFSFFTLEPQFNSQKFSQTLLNKGANQELVRNIISRLESLNNEIGQDTVNLGPGFKIGHSYFCPVDGQPVDEEWYEAVIDTEIIPLLSEYWFDNPEKVTDWRARLFGKLV